MNLSGSQRRVLGCTIVVDIVSGIIDWPMIVFDILVGPWLFF